MERASSNCALRVRMNGSVDSLSVGMSDIASSGGNDGAGGSCTRDNAICHCTFSLLGPMVRSQRVWG